MGDQDNNFVPFGKYKGRRAAAPRMQQEENADVADLLSLRRRHERRACVPVQLDVQARHPASPSVGRLLALYSVGKN